MKSLKKRLSELMPGDSGIIVGFSGDNRRVLRRLVEMGMTRGEVVRVVRNAPLKDPIELEVRGYNISIKRCDAGMIIVEVVGNNDSPSYGSGEASCKSRQG